MTITKVLAAALTIAASPVLASQSTDMSGGAPPASPDALYCMRVEAHTGTRIETVECWTREQWAEADVDVDKDWAKEGVKVIEAQAG